MAVKVVVAWSTVTSLIHIGVIANHCMIFYTLFFFHLGSGTMFLRPEKIVRHQSLETVDIDRLKDLLVK